MNTNIRAWIYKNTSSKCFCFVRLNQKIKTLFFSDQKKTCNFWNLGVLFLFSIPIGNLQASRALRTVASCFQTVFGVHFLFSEIYFLSMIVHNLGNKLCNRSKFLISIVIVWNNHESSSHFRHRIQFFPWIRFQVVQGNSQNSISDNLVNPASKGIHVISSSDNCRPL